MGLNAAVTMTQLGSLMFWNCTSYKYLIISYSNISLEKSTNQGTGGVRLKKEIGQKSHSSSPLIIIIKTTKNYKLNLGTFDTNVSAKTKP